VIEAASYSVFALANLEPLKLQIAGRNSRLLSFGHNARILSVFRAEKELSNQWFILPFFMEQ
jgi:hypothetical protein